MGKSRSATVAIAYLLHRQPDTLTPQAALAILREARPLCEPNSGFMEQLNIYHKMGCPDDITGHPLYSRWMYNREVEESVACGRAPEISSVLFEDEQPHQQKEGDQSTEIKCRKCRYVFCVYFFPHVFRFGMSNGIGAQKFQTHTCKYSVHHPTRRRKTDATTLKKPFSNRHRMCACLFTPPDLDGTISLPQYDSR